MNDPLQAQIEQARQDLKEARDEVTALELRLRSLLAQLAED